MVQTCSINKKPKPAAKPAVVKPVKADNSTQKVVKAGAKGTRIMNVIVILYRWIYLEIYR